MRTTPSRRSEASLAGDSLEAGDSAARIDMIAPAATTNESASIRMAVAGVEACTSRPARPGPSSAAIVFASCSWTLAATSCVLRTSVTT